MSSETSQNDYRRKVKTREELRQIIGSLPRKKSVIMCHGAFDLVHPGHVSHLMYAKSKADILVGSITSDAHISKANYRPFVPQQLRAMNLAALEVVDYVIIDQNQTPIENIQYLQPDYFAKGYEYSEQGVHPKTREESSVLSSYGGELIFTPGDVVYSSTAFIEATPPNISVEKLVTLMESEGVTFDALRDALKDCAGVGVHVVGDTIVDSYVYCDVIGSSASKTPTMSLKFERQVDYVGGAAIVAQHLRGAGAAVRFSTILGDDRLGSFVRRALSDSGIECEPYTDSTRGTTQKNVFIAGGQRMLKVDKVDNRPISDTALEHLTVALSTSNAGAVVFSDFRHGIFNRSTIPRLKNAVPTGQLRVADSQVASRWGNILDFEGFDLITPNEREARFTLGDQDSVIRPLALELYKRSKCKTLILKLGGLGILTYRAPSHDVRSFFSVDSFAHNVVDPVGAGDALLAYATLVLATKGSDVVASILGSLAAAIACEQEGNIPIASEDVLNKVNAVEKQASNA